MPSIIFNPVPPVEGVAGEALNGDVVLLILVVVSLVEVVHHMTGPLKAQVRIIMPGKASTTNPGVRWIRHVKA